MSKKYKEKKPWPTKIGFFDRLSSRNRNALFKHLATMIEAGIPLEKALIAIHNQTKSKSFHKVLHNFLRDLGAGEDLSSSMKTMPRIFDDLVVSLVAVGERTGTLDQALFRISEQYEKAGELQSKILGALLYPMIVIFGTLATVLYLVFVLLPQIIPLFISLNVELPWTTVFIISASDFLAAQGHWVVVGFVVFLVMIFLALKNEKIKYIYHKSLLYIPIVSALVKKTQITRFSQMLGVLLASGIPIVEAFKISSQSMDHLVYRRSLNKIAESIKDGRNVSTFLGEHEQLFSPFITQVISVGEQTGQLDKSFFSVAKFTDKEIDDVIKVLTTLLEPALMVFIGGIVGFVALAVITPIYSLTSSIGG